MNDVTRNFGVPLPPTNWPQDALVVPDGYGLLSDIDEVNKKGVRQEYFCLAGNTPFLSYGQRALLNLNAPEAGDFWIASICWFAVRDTAGFLLATTVVDADITLTDMQTGYQFFSPSAPLTLFRCLGSLGDQAGGRFRQILEEPYCLRRQSGLSLLVQMQTLTTNLSTHSIFFTFDGWIEYKNASQ